MMNAKEVFEIHIKDEYNYLFSYGGLSRFFTELSENKRFMGTKCPKCGIVWCPPRITCSKCFCSTQWVQLSNEGEVLCSVGIITPTPKLRQLGFPLVTALIKLDGSDTCFKAIVIPKENEGVQKGTRVRAVFKGKIESIADFYFGPT